MPLAVVTGAAIRVGRAIAEALAGAGYDVVIHAGASNLDDTVRAVEGTGRRAYPEHADLTDDAAIDAFADRVNGAAYAADGVDVLVNSAGAFAKVPFARIDRDAYRRMQRINVEAPFFLTQRLLPALKRSASPHGASVVNIVDIAADRVVSGYAHYTVSKAGLAALTKALAVELAPEGVRVNGVAPGVAAFPPDFTAEQRAAVLKRVPMGREGTPADVAAAVVFLVRAPYVNGVIIPVDGGRAAVL